MANTDVVRDMFDAYLAGDALRGAALLDEAFTFTSPQDDHIDKAAFMAQCFPTAQRVSSQELLHVVGDGGDGVFVMYEYVLRDSGERHRNTEHIVVRDGLLVETNVFFGGRY